VIRNTVLGIAASMLLLSGCATGLSPAGTGLFTDVKGPITATDLVGTKQGTSCAKTIIGLFVSGDASIEAAKQAGGIKKVASADYHTKGYYPFIGQTCVMVTGQ
jgi:TRL-like protein family